MTIPSVSLGREGLVGRWHVTKQFSHLLSVTFRSTSFLCLTPPPPHTHRNGQLAFAFYLFLLTSTPFFTERIGFMSSLT